MPIERPIRVDITFDFDSSSQLYRFYKEQGLGKPTFDQGNLLEEYLKDISNAKQGYYNWYWRLGTHSVVFMEVLPDGMTGEKEISFSKLNLVVHTEASRIENVRDSFYYLFKRFSGLSGRGVKKRMSFEFYSPNQFPKYTIPSKSDIFLQSLKKFGISLISSVGIIVAWLAIQNLGIKYLNWFESVNTQAQLVYASVNGSIVFLANTGFLIIDFISNVRNIQYSSRLA